MSEFKENDHPRDGGGKFASGGENKMSGYLEKHSGDPVAAMTDFYHQELQGKPAKVSLGALGEKDVHFTGEGLDKLRQDLRNEPLKAEVAGHVRDVLETGEYLGSRPPHKTSTKHPDVVAYHYFNKRVETSQGPKDVIIDVTERPGDRFEYRFYTLNYEGFKGFAQKRAALGNKKPSADSYRVLRPARNTRNAGLGSHISAAQTADGLSDERISPDSGRVNIYIVGEEDGDGMDHILEKNFSNARIQNWRVDTDGFLRVTAHVLKEGVYPYSAEETFGDSSFGTILPGVDPVMQYIPASEFTDAALASLEGKPVTVPLIAPGEEYHQWRKPDNALSDFLTVGTIAGTPTITEDGAIACDMLIMDPQAIEDIQNKKLIEVSAGYNGDLAVGEGDFAGRQYDATQTNLQFNHVLLLPEGMGRLGYDVRIINQLPNQTQEKTTMPITLKVQIGNKQRSFKFQNEDDAQQAETMLEEEKQFNAEAVQAAISAKEELEAQIADLQKQLVEHDQNLTEAKKQIEELLTPAAQEAMAQEVIEQGDAEEAIIEAETDNSDPAGDEEAAEEKKDEFANALKKCASLAERRAVTVTRVMNSRGLKVEGWTQDAFDGAFEMLAANAKSYRQAKETHAAPARVLNGAPVRVKNGGTPMNARDRMLRPMKAKNAKPAPIGQK